MMKACRLNVSSKILTMALLGAAAGSPAVADGISPGLWQVTQTVTMNGAQVFSSNASVPPVAYLYITSATGAYYEQIVISNIQALVN